MIPPRDRKRGFLLNHEGIDGMQHWNIERRCETNFHLWHPWPRLSPAAIPYTAPYTAPYSVAYAEEDSNSTENIVSRE